jgi:hypothetical protein
MKNGFRIAAVLAVLAAGLAGAQAPAKWGLGVKMGEGAGGFGLQFQHNFSKHWQAAAGAGGISPFSWSSTSFNARTDSYFLHGKYYLGGWYFASGYSLKITKVQVESGGVFANASHTAHGIPFHAGYDFGNRRGFYFAASLGALWVPAGGGGQVEAKVADGASTSSSAAGSGPSIGLALGYYIR